MPNRRFEVFTLLLAISALLACGDDSDQTSSSSSTVTASSTSTGGSGGSGGDTVGGGGGAAGGAGGDTCEAQLPSSGLYATFDIVGQTYHAAIDNPTGIQQALDLWNGTSTASIPNGELVCSSAPYECAWSFHQDPATIQ